MFSPLSRGAIGTIRRGNRAICNRGIHIRVYNESGTAANEKIAQLLKYGHEYIAINVSGGKEALNWSIPNFNY